MSGESSKELAVPEEVVDAELVDMDANPGRTERLAELAVRRSSSMTIGQIDNSKLYAGSSMYYYCRYCGVQTDVLPETWFVTPPRKVCDDCTSLITLGWHDGEMPSFPTSN